MSGEQMLGPVYALYWSELCNYLKRTFGAGPPDPQDVVQQAFMRFAALPLFDEVHNIRAYLYRIAHNVFVEECRRLVVNRNAVAGMATRHGSGIDEVTPERVLIANETMRVLRSVIKSQPETRRRSFLMNRLEGLSCAEIARRTGYSESAVKKHISLVMADLESAVNRAEASKLPARGTKLVHGAELGTR